jgi:hypothetical protein
MALFHRHGEWFVAEWSRARFVESSGIPRLFPPCVQFYANLRLICLEYAQKPAPSRNWPFKASWLGFNSNALKKR